MLNFAATIIVTLFVVLDPLGNLPFFLALTEGEDHGHRRRVALRAIGVACAVLLAFGLAGQALLHFLGISLPAFRIAGGALLFLVSVDMLFARPSGIRTVTNAESREAEERTAVAVFPLGVPLIAGPGAITTVMLLMGEARGSLEHQALVLALTLAMLGVSLVALLVGSRLMDRLGVTGINVIGRISGIILAALAVQFVIDGLKSVITAVG